jgi:chromosome segregation ATPase
MVTGPKYVECFVDVRGSEKGGTIMNDRVVAIHIENIVDPTKTELDNAKGTITNLKNTLKEKSEIIDALKKQVETEKYQKSPITKTRASSSWDSNYSAEKAFNGTNNDVHDCWHTGGNTNLPQWIEVSYEYPQKVSRYFITTRNHPEWVQPPKKWVLDGYNESSKVWERVHAQNYTGFAGKGNMRKDFVVNAKKSYRTFRLTILESYNSNTTSLGQYVAIAEFEIYQDTSGLLNQINSLYTTVQSLETQLSKANEKIAEQKKIIKDRDDTIRTLETERATLQSTVKTLTTNLSNVNAKMQQASTDIETLKKQKQDIENLLNNAQEQLKQQGDQIQQLTEEKKDLVNKVSDLQKSLGDANAAIQTLQNDKAVMFDQYNTKVQALKDAESTIQTMKTIDSKKTQEFETTKQELQKEIERLRTLYADATAKQKQTQKELETTKQDLSAEKKMTALLRQKIDEGETSMSTLRAEYTLKMKELEDARNNEVAAIQSNSQAAIALAKAETARIQKEMNAVEGKYTVAVTQNQALQQQLTSTQQANVDLEKQLDQTRASMTSLRAEYTEKLSTLRSKQAAEIEAVRTNSAAAVAAAKAETQRAEKELQAVEGKYNAAVTYSETLEESLAKEIKLKEEALAKFEDLKQSIAKISTEYGEKIVALQQRKTDLRQAYDEGKMTEVEYLRNLVKSLENEITMMLKQHAETEKRVKVLEAQLALAEQERDANKQQNLKLTESVKQVRDEYDRKIAALQTAQQEEILAMKTQNATLAQEAKATKESLQAEIKVLEGRYNVATKQISSLEGELNTERTLNKDLEGQLADNQTRLANLRNAYDTNMRQLRESQQRELEALRTKNQTAIAVEKARQQVLAKQLSGLQSQYNVAVQELQNVKDSGPKTQTLYVFIDSDTWMNDGKLHALSMRNGAVSVDPFSFKDESQVWVQMNDGIRVLEGSGEYLSTDSGCALPRGSPTPSSWSITPTQQNQREYTLRSKTCGRDLTSFKGTGVSLSDDVTQTGAWFMIPVGTM